MNSVVDYRIFSKIAVDNLMSFKSIQAPSARWSCRTYLFVLDSFLFFVVWPPTQSSFPGSL